MFPSQAVVSGSWGGVCGARCLLEISTCGREGKASRSGGPAALRTRLRLSQPSGLLWAKIAPGKTHVGQNCPALYIPPRLSLGTKPTLGKGLTSGLTLVSSS